MGRKTAAASAIIPGLGQIINGESSRAVAIWTGLLLSLLLFPLPVFGTPTFLGIWMANVYDAYDPENDFDMIYFREWRDRGYDAVRKLIDRSEGRRSK